MRTALLIGVGLSLPLAAPALAQSQGPQSAPTRPNSPTAPAAGGRTAIRDQVKHDLEQAGFTNVRIMPESFLVRATDKGGHPVMMVINPDSVMAVTDLSANGNGSSGGAAAESTTSGASTGSRRFGAASGPNGSSRSGTQTGSSAH